MVEDQPALPFLDQCLDDQHLLPFPGQRLEGQCWRERSTSVIIAVNPVY